MNREQDTGIPENFSWADFLHGGGGWVITKQRLAGRTCAWGSSDEVTCVFRIPTRELWYGWPATMVWSA